MKKELDCLGLECPLPVIKAKQMLAELEEGTWLVVSVDGNTQVENLTRMANNQGFPVEHEAVADHFVVRIQKTVDASSAVEPAGTTRKEGKTVIVFASDKMGEGDDELGKILMKSFCFSITQMDPLPETLIFYNCGVKLTVAGSPVLEDIQNLHAAGIEVYSCGTCLKFLGLEDELQVGQVSNMYEILEMLMQAGHIVKP